MDLRETQEFLDQEQALDDMKAVLSTPAGRRFVWRRIFGRAGVLGLDTFVPGHPDITSFKEGARIFAVELFVEVMREVPDSFLIMQREAIEHEQRRKTENHRTAGNGDSHD